MTAFFGKIEIYVHIKKFIGMKYSLNISATNFYAAESKSYNNNLKEK